MCKRSACPNLRRTGRWTVSFGTKRSLVQIQSARLSLNLLAERTLAYLPAVGSAAGDPENRRYTYRPSDPEPQPDAPQVPPAVLPPPQGPRLRRRHHRRQEPLPRLVAVPREPREVRPAGRDGPGPAAERVPAPGGDGP